MSTSPGETLVVGTRGSLLARAQTGWVVEQLRAAHPGLQIHTQIITTAGDRDQTRPLPEIGTKGLFTADLERALLDGSIDLAVHSAKDLQSMLPEGLEILAYPVREDPRDAWVAAGGVAFEDLPAGSVVGTSSLRRQAQLLMQRRDLTFVTLRGNVDTRIRKIERGDCAGAVLAMAGLKRAGLARHVTHPFDPTVCLPAPAQGALALEGRADDDRIRGYLGAIHDPATALAVECERAILAELDAGCRAPVAVYAWLEGDRLLCEALVADPRGERWARTCADYAKDSHGDLIDRVVAELVAADAREIIAACRM